jgi:glyoxylase-like metal-dependent hydrolase (beta-lactamase superfamily II)
MSFVAAYILVRKGQAAIVDLGTAGSESAIEEGLKAAGAGWDSVKHIVLTHLHDDHIGGLAEIIPKVKTTVYAGAGDLASIISPQTLKPLADGDEVFGLRVIDTPGHTLGHISIFDPATGVLVAGDALRTTGGLVGSDPQYTADEAKANESVRKLAAMDVKAILPGHGEPLTAGASKALKDLAAGLPA